MSDTLAPPAPVIEAAPVAPKPDGAALRKKMAAASNNSQLRKALSGITKAKAAAVVPSPAVTDKSEVPVSPTDSAHVEIKAVVEPSTAGDETPAPAAPVIPDDGIIDLSTPLPAVDAAPAADDLKGFSDEAKAKINEAQKDAATKRRRAQEAEAARDSAVAEAETLKQRLAEMEAAPPTLANNMLGHVSDPRWLDFYEKDSNEIKRKLQKAGFSGETATHQFPTGNGQWEERELTPDHFDYAENMIEHARARRDQLAKYEASSTKATPLVEQLTARLPEFKARHEQFQRINWNLEAPEVSVKAAIGDLVTSGEYVLIKKSQVKAPGATSPGSEKAGALNAMNQRRTPAEIAGTLPSARPSHESVPTMPSQLLKRAMTAGPRQGAAIKEMIAFKTRAAAQRQKAMA